VLADYRAPYRGRSPPVNAWWGSFDLAVSLFSGAPANPPSDDFIMRNAMDSQEVAVGWWPRGTRSTARRPSTPIRPDGFGRAGLAPATAHWKEGLGEYVPDRYDCRDEL
jgi:hypothetical protein